MGIRLWIGLWLVLTSSWCGWMTPCALADGVPRIKPTTIPTPRVRPELRRFAAGADGNFYVVRQFYISNLWGAVVSYWPEMTGALAGLAALRFLRHLRRVLRCRGTPGVPYCAKCGYQLTGLSGNRCPECGTALTPENRVVAHSIRRNVVVYSSLIACLLTVYPLLWLSKPNRHPRFANWWCWRSEWLADVIQRNGGKLPWSRQPFDCEQFGQILEMDRAGQVRRIFESAPERILEIRPSIDGAGMIGFCSESYQGCLWDMATGRRVAPLPGIDEDCFFHVSYSTDGHFIYGQNKRRWDSRTGKEVSQLDCGAVSDAALILAAPGSPWLVAVEPSLECRILNRTGKTVLATLPGTVRDRKNNLDAVLSPDGRRLCLMTAEGYNAMILVWDLERREVLQHWELSDIRGAAACAINGEARWLVAGNGRGFERQLADLNVYDLLTGEQVATLECSGKCASILGISRDGRFVFCELGPQDLVCYDLSNVIPANP